MIDSKAIVKGARNLGDVVRELGGVFILLIVLAAVVGVVVYQTGSNGSLTVSNTTQTNIDALETTFDTQVTDNATSASGTVAGLVVLAIILVLFGAFLYGRKGKGGLN